jgi:hypothetical protein
MTSLLDLISKAGLTGLLDLDDDPLATRQTSDQFIF